MTVRKTILAKVHFCIALLLLVLTAALNMQRMESGSDGVMSVGTLTALTLMWCVAGIAKIYADGYYLYKPPLFVTLIVGYAFWTLLLTMTSPAPSMKESLTNLFSAFMPGVVVLTAYNSARNWGVRREHLLMFWLMFGILLLQYLRVYSFFNLVSEDSHLISAYYLLYMMPVLLLTDSRLLRIAAIVLTTLIIFSSFKRAGVMALAIALLAYLVLKQLTSQHVSVRGLTFMLTVIVLAGGAFFFLASQGEETLIERFQNLGDDHGSGRSMVWAITMGMIDKADIITQLVGHGNNAVLADSPINLSAHNDFLEVTYDYGYIGIGLYVSALLAIIGNAWAMLRQRSRYLAPLAFLIIPWLILSMISHIIIYYWANIVLMEAAYFLGCWHHDLDDES